jgi:hypothetical protein
MRALLVMLAVASTATASALLSPNECAELGWTCPDQPPCDDRQGRCDVCGIPEGQRWTCNCPQRKCGMEYAFFGTCPCERVPRDVQPHDMSWCAARGYFCPAEDCNTCAWPDAQHVTCHCFNTSPNFYATCTCVDQFEVMRSMT